MYVFSDLHSVQTIIYTKDMVIYDNSKNNPTERLKTGFNNCGKYTSVNHRPTGRKRGEARRPKMSGGRRGQRRRRSRTVQPHTGVGRSPPLRNKGEGRSSGCSTACTTRTHQSSTYLLHSVYYSTACGASPAHARGCTIVRTMLNTVGGLKWGD